MLEEGLTLSSNLLNELQRSEGEDRLRVATIEAHRCPLGVHGVDIPNHCVLCSIEMNGGRPVIVDRNVFNQNAIVAVAVDAMMRAATKPAILYPDIRCGGECWLAPSFRSRCVGERERERGIGKRNTGIEDDREIHKNEENRMERDREKKSVGKGTGEEAFE